MSQLYRHYKEKIASRYLPVHPDEIVHKIMDAEYYFTSVKYDGHFGILEIKSGNPVLFGADGMKRDVPKILEEAKKINKDVVLVGEICCFKDQKSQTNLQVSAALDDPENHDLRFGVFDLLEYDGEVFPGDLKEKNNLISNLGMTGSVFSIQQEFMVSRKDIAGFYQQVLPDAEGVVVKSSTGVIYKLKPVIHLDMVILGYALGEGNFLRELLLGFVTQEGQFQIVTRCGNGFSEQDRKDWLKILEPLQVNSEFTEVSGAKTAFIMVKPTLVVEIKCLDLINETIKGIVSKMLLSFGKEGFKKLHPRNTWSCIAPVFIRQRKDKSVSFQDAGEEQAAHILPFISSNKDQHESIASDIIQREVYIKSGKGGTAVRKFLALKTNKESTGYYPPYCVMYTDFSSGRKEPLEQEIYLCENEKEVVEKIKALKEENIKKGWEPKK